MSVEAGHGQIRHTFRGLFGAPDGGRAKLPCLCAHGRQVLSAGPGYSPDLRHGFFKTDADFERLGQSHGAHGRAHGPSVELRTLCRRLLQSILYPQLGIVPFESCGGLVMACPESFGRRAVLSRRSHSLPVLAGHLGKGTRQPCIPWISLKLAYQGIPLALKLHGAGHDALLLRGRGHRGAGFLDRVSHGSEGFCHGRTKRGPDCKSDSYGFSHSAAPPPGVRSHALQPPAIPKHYLPADAAHRKEACLPVFRARRLPL